MKKILFLLLLMVSLDNVNACDICGCGAGGGYLGILPGFKSHFISLRYTGSGLKTHLGPNGTITYLTTDERFQNFEVWGAIRMGKRFRVTAFLPYSFISKSNAQGITYRNGIADIMAIGYYNLLEKQNTTKRNKLLVQSLWLGAGVKAPTGKYDAGEKNITESVQNTFQLGTASTDFILHAMYDLRIHDAGLNTNLSYRINTMNPYDYKYGNKAVLNLLAYYKFKTGMNSRIAPNAGLLQEWSGKDTNGGIEVWATGGYLMMGTIGVEYNLNRWGFGANIQLPVTQNLGENKVKADKRGMVYVSFSF